MLDSRINMDSSCLADPNQEKYAAPMPWIGMYIATGCLICSIGMAADAVVGFYSHKLWLPCNFFSLNAASLTLLAVAMKLPVDLTDEMPGGMDQLAKLSSLVFMCTIMGNFSISIGSMNGNEMLVNLTALGILVVTISVNVCIQLHTGVIKNVVVVPSAMVMILMYALFVMLCFSALIISTTKDSLAKKCNELHDMMRREQIQENTMTVVEKLKDDVRKYWIIIETGNPEFVMARLSTSCSFGIICCLATLVLLLSNINIVRNQLVQANSVYKWTTCLIVSVQMVGTIVGTIAPIFRWLVAMRFKCSKRDIITSCWKEFKIEKYWIQKLKMWKERPLGLRIRSQGCRKMIQITKNLILNIFIGVQILNVLLSKAVQFLSLMLAIPIFSCGRCFVKLKWKLMSTFSVSYEGSGLEEEFGEKSDLSRYVLLLEGEEELPQSVLNNISQALDSLILKGTKEKPKHMKELLHKSTGTFEGVRKFDSDRIPCLYSEDPPHCWTMPLATLTSIAIALHGINRRNCDWLLKRVHEGLLLANLVERNLNTSGDSKYSRNAADLVWVGVECYGKWLDIDLQKVALQGKASKETLEGLASQAKEVVLQFGQNVGGGSMTSPINWPEKVLAANSMYRICNTLLPVSDQGDENLFQELVVMIADILGACLTNLPRVITMKYHSGNIEERARSIPHAARLLGETEEILLVLQQHQLPVGLDTKKASNINEWRAVMKQENSSAFTSSLERVFTSSHPNDDELLISINKQDA